MDTPRSLDRRGGFSSREPLVVKTGNLFASFVIKTLGSTWLMGIDGVIMAAPEYSVRFTSHLSINRSCLQKLSQNENVEMPDAVLR
jgi:hypothetical protein